MTFLTDEIMNGNDWRALELAVVRLMSHCGWKDVQDIGRSGDKGADILAIRFNSNTNITDSYLVQVKAVSNKKKVGKGPIYQALNAQGYYKNKVTVVATNGKFSDSALKTKDMLVNKGIVVKLWDGKFLVDLLSKSSEYSVIGKNKLRKYQNDIVEKVLSNYYSGSKKNLFVLATGLGKTVIASTIANKLFDAGLKKILVLCHSSDLVMQLQQQFWKYISKSIKTRVFMEGVAPRPVAGINFGLYQTLFGYLGGINSDAFDLVIVDEAHHALANAFASCMNHLRPRFLIGMTATPWRGDGVAISNIFGQPVYTLSLIDGMRMGYLSQVDYRIICDNIDWDIIPNLAKRSVSVRDLNKRLFLPQRDDAIIQAIQNAMKEFRNPKIAIFSPSIRHASFFSKLLNLSRIKSANISIRNKVKRRSILLDFSAGRITALTSVEVLNEGIDLPDVNILVFLRATHSRRIFVQQLGRGLRIAPDKEKVVVLDFVSDIRRIAAVSRFKLEIQDRPLLNEIEEIHLKDTVVTFSNSRAESFIDAWLKDVVSLENTEDASESHKLNFPESLS